MSKNDDLQLQMETLAEPYRIKMVEKIRIRDRAERRRSSRRPSTRSLPQRGGRVH